MSEFVDRFIKQHKEYFARNKSFIDNNYWDNTTLYKSTIEDLTDELYNLSKYFNGEDLEKEKRKLITEIRQLGETHQRNKAASFKQENELTTSIVGRLSSFIKDCEKLGDRKLDKVQKFINYTVEIIDIHLNKCDKYLDYSMEEMDSVTETEEQIEYRGQEIKFQDDVFQKKIKIQDVISDLNLKETSEDIEIKFYKDDKAPLIMREPLCLLNEDIKSKTDSIPVTWDIMTSKELYINMRTQDIPKYNPKKHFFDQDPVALQFWSEEMNKVKYGVNIGGFFMHGWLYFHLNFFRTPIPQPDGSEPNTQPTLRDNEFFTQENLNSCVSKDYPEYYSKAMLIYGTRRFGKSVILASLAHWRTITKFNSFGTIIGGTSSDLNALTSKIKTSMTYIDKPFRMDILKQEWDNGETTFGIKENASNPIVFSTLIVQNLEQGTTKKTQKTAGLAPSVSIYDEIGKYPFLKPYLAALPSFKTPFGFKCITVLAGTGGEADLSRDAMDVLSNPEAFDLLPMNWDLLENHIDPEYITWKRRPFATFFPGQMAYEEGFIKESIPLGEYINNDHPELNKVTIDVTNWKDNKDYLDRKYNEAKNAKSSKSNLLAQQRKVQYPTDPQDCFLSSEKNIFPYEEAQKHKEYLIQTGKWDRRRSLYKDSQGKICCDISTKPLAQYPHSGGQIEAPFLIFEDIPEIKPTQYMYVAGGDFYKQADSSTDSVGTIAIYKFPLFADEFAYKLVASYSARPSSLTAFYDNCLILLEAYNAVFFPENEDLSGFQTYLEKKHLEDKYLMRNIDFSSSLEFVENGRRKWGWTPANSKSKLINMYANYCREPVVIKDDEGKDIEVKRVQTIDDIGLLDELISYKPDVNCDRLTASIGSIGFLHYLEKNYIYPKGMNRRTPEKEGEQRKEPTREKSFYLKANRRAGFYRRR